MEETTIREESVVSTRLLITEHCCRVVGMTPTQVGLVVPLMLTLAISLTALQQAGSTSPGYICKCGGALNSKSTRMLNTLQ